MSARTTMTKGVRLRTAGENILVVSADDSAALETARLLIELLGQRLGDLKKAEMERIIEAVVPSLMDRPSPAFIDQARRNAEARTAFMREYEMLDAAADVAEPVAH